jgi:CubicO group peptidase (beta-lactamase class C family)
MRLRWRTLGGVLAALVSAIGARHEVTAQSAEDLASYAPVLDSLMRAMEVPGISFAFFSSDSVLWEYVSGVKSTDSGEPVRSGTVFEAASISKPVFAVVLHGLAQDGVIDLRSPLVEYVDPVPGLEHDERSTLLTPEMLLSHQSGLPNWRTRINLDATQYDELFRPEDTLHFVANPAAGYRYSGEGFVLLQRVVEHLTSETLGSLAEARVFGPLGMTRTSFAFDARAEEDYALGHARDGQPDKWGLRASLASSTLHTTGADLGRFGVHLAAGISGGDLASLVEPRVQVADRDGTLLSWGLGLGVLDTSTGRYVYHGGNNVIFIADLIYSVEADLGYVLLTNSANGAEMVSALEDRVFGRRLRR